jgi:hypothetical protein
MGRENLRRRLFCQVLSAWANRDAVKRQRTVHAPGE